MTPQEASKLLEVTLPRVYQLIAAGKLHSRHDGRRILLERGEVLKLRDARRAIRASALERDQTSWEVQQKHEARRRETDDRARAEQKWRLDLLHELSLARRAIEKLTRRSGWK